MSERGQIAGCTDGALAGDNGQDVGIDQCTEQFHRRHGNARCALRQGIEFEHQDESHDTSLQRRADASCMGTHDVELELRQLVRWNALLRQFAEAGVDAINRIAGFQQPRHRGGAALDLRPGRRRQLHRNRPSQGSANLRQRERFLSDDDLHANLFTALLKRVAMSSSRMWTPSLTTSAPATNMPFASALPPEKIQLSRTASRARPASAG